MAGEHEHTFTILVTGPFAAGKTSLIQAIAQNPVVTTEVAVRGDEANDATDITLPMDVGTFALPPRDDGDEVVHLLMVGTPGRERFRFMADVLRTDVNIVTFVVDARASASYQEARGLLAQVMGDFSMPIVIAVNRCDDPDQARSVADYLGAAPTVPAIPCQLVDAESGREVVVEVLLALLRSTDFATATQEGSP